MEPRKRNIVCDLLKAISIIAVVLYHLGFLEFGYLGVDIFLVVSGYLFAKSLYPKIKQEDFNIFTFFARKICRLWPMTLLASAILMTIGYYCMLPDDYENLSETVFASSIFLNNILQCITTKNYWDVANEFKPLMHTWYLGIIVQGYLIFLIMYLFIRICKHDQMKLNKYLQIILLLISVGLFCAPIFTPASKFYYIWFRMFEILAGSIIYSYEDRFLKFIGKKDNKYIFAFCIFGLSYCLVINSLVNQNITINNNIILVIVTCSISSILIAISSSMKFKNDFIIKFSTLGQYTFSIFIWHQVILALYRYIFAFDAKSLDIVFYVIILFIVSIISYLWLEVKLSKYIDKNMRLSLFVCVICTIVLCSYSFYIYSIAGVVRDVPELGITVKDKQGGMHAKFNHRIYDFDKDFTDLSRKKVLVIGDSFARDWVNILLLSTIKDKIEISYFQPISFEYINERKRRIKEADIIFFAVKPDYFLLPEYLQKEYDQGKVFVIGSKKFGYNNGYIYNRRKLHNYTKLKVKVPDYLIRRNLRQKQQFGEKYIDMLNVLMDSNKSIPVFTPDGHFISQDTDHLTYWGAKYFVNLKKII